MGLGDTEPISDIVELIEHHAAVPVFLAPLPRGIAGLASRLDGRWYIVGDTNNPNAGRLRFTLAHEFGHILMDHEPAIDDDETLGSRASHPQEVAANYFAAELLMPRALVLARLTGEPNLEFVQSIAEMAGTTPWVPFYRLKTLGILKRHEALALQGAIQLSEAPRGALVDTAAHFAGTKKTRIPATGLPDGALR